MDVVRVDVVLWNEHRRLLAEPLERKPRLRVDARRAHDRERHAVARGPRAQAILGVELTPPETTDVLLVNPLGLYVTEINWTQTL